MNSIRVGKMRGCRMGKPTSASDGHRLLDDEQVRRFICDGILVLEDSSGAELHHEIHDRIARLHRHDGETGLNILPQVPQLQRVLDSPTVSGAMRSVLGEDYMQYPHRILVPSEPLSAEQRSIELRGDENGPPMGEGSLSYSYWHKDTYPPLGRTRYHVPRFLFLFYFPHDTPVEMGPTRVIPGSHYQDQLAPEDHPYAFVPDQMKAGTCLLAAFDIEHAGMSNRADQTRFMVKFVFRRTATPRAPDWQGGQSEWQTPASFLGRFENRETWSYVWDWMRGHKRTEALAPAAIDDHISRLNGTDQQRRLAAIYSLGAMGSAALQPLLDSLLTAAGQGHIEPPYTQDADGSFTLAHDDGQRRWTEGGYIFRDEAYALGCLGEPAVDALEVLLKHDDPWIALNAAFALGEIGRPAARSVSKLAALLARDDHRVIRAVLEAIACIGQNTAAAWPAIRQLLRTSRDAWQQELELDHLVGDQIHLNALEAILQSDLDTAVFEELLIELLAAPSPCSYVPATAVEILLRRGSEKGVRCAAEYLKARSWVALAS